MKTLQTRAALQLRQAMSSVTKYGQYSAECVVHNGRERSGRSLSTYEYLHASCSRAALAQIVDAFTEGSKAFVPPHRMACADACLRSNQSFAR